MAAQRWPVLLLAILTISAHPCDTEELRCWCTQKTSEFICLKFIKTILVITRTIYCDRMEVIANLTNGNSICLDPEAEWVKDLVNRIINSENPTHISLKKCTTPATPERFQEASASSATPERIRGSSAFSSPMESFREASASFAIPERIRGSSAFSSALERNRGSSEFSATLQRIRGSSEFSGYMESIQEASASSATLERIRGSSAFSAAMEGIPDDASQPSRFLNRFIPKHHVQMESLQGMKFLYSVDLDKTLYISFA